MSAQEKLFAGVVKVTGDDSIVAVTELRPSGSVLSGAAGAASGSVALARPPLISGVDVSLPLSDDARVSVEGVSAQPEMRTPAPALTLWAELFGVTLG